MKERWELMKYYDELLTSYIRVAELSKKLYDHTKGRKGLYKILNKFAMSVNRWAGNKGYEIFLKNVNLMDEILKELIKIAQ